MVSRDRFNMDFAESTKEFVKPRSGSGADALRVWLVDDSENFRELLAALLEDEGGIVCEQQFPTAEDALTALQSSRAPDAILLDVRMPGMGGLAAVSPMRKLSDTMRILMLTTFGDTDVRARAITDGASDFLLKSYQVSEIAERVKTACANPQPVPAGSRDEILQAWPNCRALDETCQRSERVQSVSIPEPGRRSDSGDVECRSNRLVRGVRMLRGWLSLKMGRHGRKEVGDGLAALASSR